MKFKYSICHPEKEKIEYHNTPISGGEVMEIAKNHPWLPQLELTESLPSNKIYYSPSLDFTNLENGRSFGLTADFNKQKQLTFSLWYNRPKMVKVLFGLLGKMEVMSVDTVWSYDFEPSLFYLEEFVKENYSSIEKLYKK